MRYHALLTLPLLLAACEGLIKTDDDTWGTADGGDEGEPAQTTDTEEYEPTSCLHEWFRIEESALPITAVCLSGDYANAPFYDPTIEVPCGTEDDPRTLFAGQLYDESSTGDRWLVQAASGGYLCDADGPEFDDYHMGGGGTWQLRFEPEAFSTCSDYTVNHTGYVVFENFGQVQEPSWDTVACPYVNEYSGLAFMMAPMAPEPEPSNAIESAPGACTPGSGSFELLVRDTEVGEDGTVALRLTPVAPDGASFPERAWLRSIVVNDWGTVDNLHIAGLDARLHQNGSRVWGGHGVHKGDGPVQFAVGEVAMSAMFATSKAEHGPDLALPQVTLSWSCQVDPASPHFSTVALPGYVGTLPASLGVDHRITVWLDWERGMMLLAPEGRFADRIVAELVPLGANKASFSGHLASYDATFEGVIVRKPGAIGMGNLVVTVDDTPMPLPSTTLTKIPGTAG